VVTRHFGGVKLGTAGLARAYQDAVRAALADLPLRMRAESAGLRVTLDYRHIDMLRRALPIYEAHILRESFDEAACFHIAVPEKHFEAFCRFLHEQSAGSALVDMVSP
jgi:putative IMPACT (imprinted ancient) family translation regulator